MASLVDVELKHGLRVLCRPLPRELTRHVLDIAGRASVPLEARVSAVGELLLWGCTVSPHVAPSWRQPTAEEITGEDLDEDLPGLLDALAEISQVAAP